MTCAISSIELRLFYFISGDGFFLPGFRQAGLCVVSGAEVNYPSPELMKALYRLLDAFGAAPRGTTAFARFWNAVGEVEDYAGMARTPAEQTLAELLRFALERELRYSAPRDALHPDARGVEAFLQSRHRRR